LGVFVLFKKAAEQYRIVRRLCRDIPGNVVEILLPYYY